MQFNQWPIAISQWYDLARRSVLALESFPRNDNNAPKLTVESADTHLYFYADVDEDRCLALIKAVREIDARLRTEKISRQLAKNVPATPIWLHVQSGGGGVFPGFSTADQLAQVETPIYSVAEGLCASAATFIHLACTQRYITQSSFMLIHQFTSAKWGTHSSFKDELAMQEMLMERMVRFYIDHSHLSKKKVIELLSHDSWLNAEQCLEAGFVEGIL